MEKYMNVRTVFLSLCIMSSGFLSAAELDVKIMVQGPSDHTRGALTEKFADALNFAASATNKDIKFDINYLGSYDDEYAKAQFEQLGDQENILILSTSLFYDEEFIEGGEENIIPLAEIARYKPQFWISENMRNMSTWEELIASIQDPYSPPNIGLVDNIPVDEVAVRMLTESLKVESLIDVSPTIDQLTKSALAGDIDVVITSANTSGLKNNFKKIDVNKAVISNRYVLYNHPNTDPEINQAVLSLMSVASSNEKYQGFCDEIGIECSELLSQEVLGAQLREELDGGYKFMCAEGTKPCRKGCCSK